MLQLQHRMHGFNCCTFFFKLPKSAKNCEVQIQIQRVGYISDK